MTWLFDVNVLVSISDAEHPFHRGIHAWLGRHKNITWATCPITENGFVRIVSQPNFKGTRRTTSEAIEFLRSMKTAAAGSHVFWPDDCSISDSDIVIEERLVVASQITDVYLVAVALRHGGKLVTFDRSIAWQCVRGATADLIEIPPSVL